MDGSNVPSECGACDSLPDCDNKERVYYNIGEVAPKAKEIESATMPPMRPPRRRDMISSEAPECTSPKDTPAPEAMFMDSDVNVGGQVKRVDAYSLPDTPPENTNYTLSPTPRNQSHSVTNRENGVPDNLQNWPWYQGDISRSDAEQMLKNQPDGSFLLRDSTTAGDYTLTVRKDGQSKCLKLYKNDGCFGLKVNDCTFRSVSALIEHYRHNTLAGFNKRLDTKLLSWPSRKRPKPIPATNYESLSMLADCGRQLQKTKQQYINLKERHMFHNKKLDGAQLRERVLETARDMFSQMLNVKDTDMMSEEDLSQDKKLILKENQELIRERHQTLEERMGHTQQDLKASEQTFNDITFALNYHVEVLRDAEVACEKLRIQVLEEGGKSELVECLLEECSGEAPDRSLWLMNCSRDEAILYLQNEPAGTFLIRARDEIDTPYALSIVAGNEDGSTVVKHCVINHPNGKGYGFRQDCAVFESIDELVCKHSKTSIKVYFAHMDTCLDHPVKGERPKSQGDLSEDS